MQTIWNDIRYGWRMILRTPAVSTIAIISLAIGIGATTTIFSLVNALLLRPLPVQAPERLVNVYATNPDGSSFHSFSYPDYVDYRDRARTFDQLSAYTINTYSLKSGGPSERVFGIVTSDNFFTMMGIQPLAGRFFSREPAEDQEPVVVLGNGYWRRRFGADTGVVGTLLTLNGHDYRIIGIAPTGFTGPRVVLSPDIFVPMWTQAIAIPNGAEWLKNRNAGSLELVGRLRAGSTVIDAEGDLSGIAKTIAGEFPDTHTGKGVDVRPANSGWGQMEKPIAMFMALLMAVVGMVLLIACSNVAGMALSRAAVRRREIAIRLAIGARRGRIIRQLMTENILLFLAGGIGGLIFAAWAKDLLLTFKPPVPFSLELNLSLDWRVVGFTAALSLATGVLFGLAPAIQCSRPDVLPALKDQSQSTGFRKSRIAGFFVSGQVAISLILLICTILFLNSLRNARTLNPGFNATEVMNAGLDLQNQGYSHERGAEFYRDLLTKLSQSPIIRSAALAQGIPLNGGNMEIGIDVDNFEPPAGNRSIHTDFNVVSPAYFSTLEIPIIRGRVFDDHDDDNAPHVAIINKSMAERFWPGQDVVGKRFFVGSRDDGTPVEVIGVARNAKYRTVGEEPRPYLYLPFAQEYSHQMTVHMRTAPGQAANALAELRREVASLDSNVPLLDVMPMEQSIGVSLMPLRVAATVAGILGVAGLLLSAVGIFGVISFSVAQRTREIGIRMALGAETSDVLRLVVNQGFRLSIFGIVPGIVLAFAATRLIGNLLYGISPTDAISFGIAGILCLAVAVIASYFPARKAARVDPIEALRYE